MEKKRTSAHKKPALVLAKKSAAAYAAAEEHEVLALIDMVNRGIDFSAFESIVKKYSFTLQNWAEFLHISSKTLSRYQKESKTFDPLQSERIMQIEILYSKGTEVFGSAEAFTAWLETFNLALGNRRPKDLLKNAFGIQLLMDELTRIEHGVLA